MKRFFVSAVVVVFVFPQPVVAYESLKQSDWSGGYGQQVLSNSTKFHEYYNVKYQAPGELTISSSPSNWYDPAWKYRKKLTFNNSQSKEELHDFTVLVLLEHKVNIDYLKTQSSTGHDVRFTDSDGKTLLDYEIEQWNQGGKSSIWVRVPLIKDNSTDNYIYMYYGNPDANDAENASGAWKPDYRLVAHMDNDLSMGTDALRDSSKTKANGTQAGSMTRQNRIDGQFGYATNFDGVDDSISLTNESDFDQTDQLVVSAWIYLADNGRNTFASKNLNGASANGGWYWDYAGFNSGDLELCVLGGVIGRYICGGTPISIQTWHYVAAVFDRNLSGNNRLKLYVDGGEASVTYNTGGTFTTIGANNTSVVIGRITSFATSIFSGKIDEVRIIDKPRSKHWFQAEYLNQTNKFVTYDHEELFGSELLSSIFDAEHGTSWGYLSYTADEPEKTAVKVKVRTGNNMYMSDASDFEVCDSITNKSDISTNNCVTDGHRYIQYQVILDTTEAGKTPIFKEISITDFLAHPVVKGISTVSSPSPLPSVIYDLESPQAGPMPSPSPMQNSDLLQPFWDFIEALFN